MIAVIIVIICKRRQPGCDCPFAFTSMSGRGCGIIVIVVQNKGEMTNFSLNLHLMAAVRERKQAYSERPESWCRKQITKHQQPSRTAVGR